MRVIDTCAHRNRGRSTFKRFRAHDTGPTGVRRLNEEDREERGSRKGQKTESLFYTYRTMSIHWTHCSKVA